MPWHFTSCSTRLLCTISMIMSIHVKITNRHPLIILLAGLRPVWGRESERGNLALRQGDFVPLHPYFLVDRGRCFLLSRILSPTHAPRTTISHAILAQKTPA